MTETPVTHQPLSLSAMEKVVNSIRGVIAKYPVIAVVATAVLANYAPVLKPYVVAVGRWVGLSCQ